MYHPDNLDYFYKESLKYTTAEIEELKEKLIIGDEKAVEVITKVVETALMRALDIVSPKERKYIDVLIELKKNHNNLASYSKNLLKEKKLVCEALEIDVLSAKNINIFGLS